MSKRTTILGTACVLGMALAAGQAAAATLTDFAGSFTTSYGSNDDSTAGSDAVNSWLIGASLAGPLSDLPNMNFQVDGSYDSTWGGHSSNITWNFGGSAFWANMDGRFGANFNYMNVSHFGSLTSGGALGEWYFGDFTAMGKGGWLSSSGTGTGGHGNYLGGALAAYLIPNLAITGGIEWGSLVGGQGVRHLGRGDARVNAYEIMFEYLFSEEFPLSGYAGFTYTDNNIFNSDTNNSIWMVGVRWYTGGGSLEDHHRNGNLNPWLPAVGASGVGSSFLF